MSETKTVSFRLPTEKHQLFTQRAAERNVKPAILAAEVIDRWLSGESMAATLVVPVPPSQLTRWEAQRLESLACRMAWTIIVALSPTLDEDATAEVVNELMQPTQPDWTSDGYRPNRP